MLNVAGLVFREHFSQGGKGRVCTSSFIIGQTAHCGDSSFLSVAVLKLLVLNDHTGTATACSDKITTCTNKPC